MVTGLKAAVAALFAVARARARARTHTHTHTHTHWRGRNMEQKTGEADKRWRQTLTRARTD